MALTIRIPKVGPKPDRMTARMEAHVAAEARGHQLRELRKATIRLERVDGSPSFEYVIEFPDATPTP